MDQLKGISASPGIAIGPAFVIEEERLTFEHQASSGSESELERLDHALNAGRAQLGKVLHTAGERLEQAEAAIFEAHIMFLDDPALLERVRKGIVEKVLSAPAAWSEGTEFYARQMEAMQDEYLKARAADIRDVGRRVLRLLLGKQGPEGHPLTRPSIVLARDLAPSDTVRLEKTLVLGFCTAEGGPTSHTAILAKALGLPAVVGAGEALMLTSPGTLLIMDGDSGLLWVDPDASTQARYTRARESAQATAALELKAAHQPAVTRDGLQVEIVANVGTVDDSRRALELGAEGIGLLRTEFLYLDRDAAPTEAEQTQAYRSILEVMQDRPVVVRTLDVGGDKPLPYLDMPPEQNAFLGWRAIRMCLDRPDFFKTQLRALWRASAGHDLRVMFPMIATLDEFRRARQLWLEARQEVAETGIALADSVQLGIMVEIPSVAMLAELFAVEVDFFSVGTNDLTQYTMAADRTNPHVAGLGDACHPAVLRQIRSVAQAAHAHGKWVGICGELGGDPAGLPLLLGLGLDELSMTPHSIPGAKAIIRRWSAPEARALADEALRLDSAEAVRQLVTARSPKSPSP